jgi:2-polyprenyl-6-methoxyphenol hydroxylase-like FAD-dependent oxidoreductase
MAALPTNDGLTCIVAGWDPKEHPGSPAEINDKYLKCLASVPAMAERISAGKREERFRGLGALPSFFRKPFGQGWALVGDAGFYKHPIPAQGITDAFRDAEALSQAIHDGFTGSRPLMEALAQYERLRNEAVMPMYESTVERASLAPPSPQLIHLFTALHQNQVETDRFFGTDAGTVSMSEFFAPANLQRIIASAKG